jgi:D-amino-acid dehydrogenase
VGRHVVVVGAGVIGLFCALHCAYRGWRVSVVERHGERRDGCSFGNTGLIVPSHFVPLAAPGMVAQALKWMLDPRAPFHIKPRASWQLLRWGIGFARACNPERARRAAALLHRLAMASRAGYEELAVPENDFGLRSPGVLMLCKTAHGLEEEARAAQQAQALGMSAEVLDAGQAAARDPGVRMDIAGAVHYPLDCNLVPERLVAVLQRRLSEQGVRFVWHKDIVQWALEGSRIRAAVCADTERIEADEFVLAGGAWSATLAQALGIDIPMQAGKGYSLTLAQPAQSPQRCAVLTEARVAVSPMAGGTLRFGGTMEIAGLDEAVSAERIHSIVAAIARYYPQFGPADFVGIRPWCGLRPLSADGLPYLGRPARYSNLVIATGHAMMGVTLGPVTGKIAAQALAGEPTGFDMAQLSPDRYGSSAVTV